MLQVNRISKSYGIQTILEDVSFIINRGDRVGLVGPNGSGKTTLLRIITGYEKPDSGRIDLEPSTTIGYLAQGLDASFGESVGSVMRSGIAGLQAAQVRVETLAEQMAAQPPSTQMLAEYGDALERFEALGGYALEHRAESILAGLELQDIPSERPVQQLSGGQRTRLGLARLLVAEPKLLLLDEPTNHLDIDALEWLEGFLADYRGAAMIVSHDRTFLNNTVHRILALNPRTHHIEDYAGDYSDFEIAKALERDKQWMVWKDQQDEIARLASAARHVRGIAKFRKGGKADSGDKFAGGKHGFFAGRGVTTIRKAKHLEARIEKLLTDDKVDKPRGSWQMKLDFGEMTRGGQIVIALEEAGHAFDGKLLFQHVNLVLRHGDRVALIGPNGTGKTTLLRAITGGLQLSEGAVRVGSGVKIGYMPQEHETLDPEATPLSTVQALSSISETESRNFLHYFLFEGEEVFTPVKKLSYGERARLILARLVVSGVNCLVLDEPVNHLDIPSRERFEAALDAFPGTVLVAVHDRAFIDRFAAALWVIEDGTIRLRLPQSGGA
ncbi:MAG TPA: ABC-F family ATP-binding cassette domain-containing protein [Anaerolineae bacterium]